jgi:hypothetical protein
MKIFLLPVFLLAFLSSNKAQTELFGQYKYFTANNETLRYNYTLNLNCDKTFLIKDSTTNSSATGTWKVKDDQTLILQIDSITFKAKKSGGNRRIKYFIKDGQLHEEIMTKKQYKKQNKNLDRLLQSCLPGMWEEYELFEAKQKNRYLLKVDLFRCTKSTSANIGLYAIGA